jgi:hypothetical protein
VSSKENEVQWILHFFRSLLSFTTSLLCKKKFLVLPNDPSYQKESENLLLNFLKGSARGDLQEAADSYVKTYMDQLGGGLSSVKAENKDFQVNPVSFFMSNFRARFRSKLVSLK